MCLQWCYVRAWVIDNDLPCRDCSAYGQAPVGLCASCAHRRDGERGPMCSLTRTALPYAGGCCHYNADLDAWPAALPLDALPIAPWVLAVHQATSPATLFAGYESAPDLELRGGQACVALDELAVPLVYGVTADAWTQAVGVPEPEPAPNAPPHFAVALDALETMQAGDDATPVHARLLELLEVAPLEGLPEPWRKIVAETLALLGERHEV